MIADKMKNMVANSSAIRAMFEEGTRLAGIYGRENVFDFSLGNPNVPAPQIVKDAIVELVNDTDPVVLHGYTNSNSGYPEVREAIAKSLNERFDTKFSGKNIVMTVGAAGGLNVILKSLINPGDEVIAWTGLPVVMWDERLTTAEAERTLMETGVRRENRKQFLDQMAAVLILQGYLDRMNMNKDENNGEN